DLNQTRNLTRSDGSLRMEEKKLDSDAFELIYNRYIKDDPARVVSFQEELTKAEIASEIYNLRDQAGLTQAQLAVLAGTNASVIEDIEEADYEGDFLSMASRIANALHRRVEVRLVPVEGKESVGVTA
ncbi:MAG: helix-turn-helix transcriptional regulator, partial [Desulfomonile sp.]